MSICKYLFFISGLLLSFLSFAQRSKDSTMRTIEIGADFTFGASDRGNHLGGGVKLAFVNNNYLVVGPVIRYNRVNFLNGSFGTNKNFNCVGAGGYMEMHFAKVAFLGLEMSVVNSPFKFTEVFSGTIDLNKNVWTVNGFVSAGFAHRIKNKVRVSMCASYDVINRGNSPFFLSYPVVGKEGSQRVIPIMYRMGVSVPLVSK